MFIQDPRAEQVSIVNQCIFDPNNIARLFDYFNKIRMSRGQFRLLAIMVYDSFRGHLEESVKKKFHESSIDLAVIPGGLTSICQPLDVALNKPFKDNLHKEWHIWMANGGAGETAHARRAALVVAGSSGL